MVLLRGFYITAAGEDADVEIPDTAAVTMVTGISDTASSDTAVNDDTSQTHHHDSCSRLPSGMITSVNCTLYWLLYEDMHIRLFISNDIFDAWNCTTVAFCVFLTEINTDYNIDLSSDQLTFWLTYIVWFLEYRFISPLLATMFDFRWFCAVDGGIKDELEPVTAEVTKTTNTSETTTHNVTSNDDKTTVNDTKSQTLNDNKCSRLRSGTITYDMICCGFIPRILYHETQDTCRLPWSSCEKNKHWLIAWSINYLIDLLIKFTVISLA